MTKCNVTIATLAMVLNALHLDPDRLWKGPWRWFSEDMFDCCTPLSVAKKQGIVFEEFICLAKCNGANITSFRMKKSVEKVNDLDSFRQKVIEICAQERIILVCNYSRKGLGQTGDGHFSPIGGYHKEDDRVLILDVARFKYPPHWVSLSVLYEAMFLLDSSTNQPRGIILHI